MRFVFVDSILERSADRIVALKHVAAGEEYLQDHFPTFPVMPGVLMLEALAQSARALASAQGQTPPRLVLSEARAVKYGVFVKPGDTLLLEVDLLRGPDDARSPDALWQCRGKATALKPDGSRDVAAAGRFALRALRPRAGRAGVRSEATPALASGAQA